MAMLRIRCEGGRCYSREHCPVLDSALPGENLPWWWFRFKEPPSPRITSWPFCYIMMPISQGQTYDPNVSLL